MKSCTLASYRSCRKSKMDDFGEHESAKDKSMDSLDTLFFYLQSLRNND